MSLTFAFYRVDSVNLFSTTAPVQTIGQYDWSMGLASTSRFSVLRSMAVWIALLRGVNVGGTNKLPMKDLVRVLEDAGYEAVKTHLQSGNVVLQVEKSTARDLSARIAAEIDNAFGFSPTVMALRVDDFGAAALANPYPNADADPKAHHLFFLEETPKTANLLLLNKLKSPSESFTIRGRVLYLHAPDGVGRSKLAKGVEGAMGVNSTARNWRTVQKLMELAAKFE